MCGLCGVLSTVLSSREIEDFNDLMTLSVLRGYYGAGIVAVPSSPTAKPSVIRSAELTAAELVYSHEFFQLKKDKPRWSCLMGHARFPTTGRLDLASAHPHEAGDIIGMHNGTLTTVRGRKVKDTESDSSLLFKAISDVGVDNALKLTRGSYSLVYANPVKDTLSFLRNAERPMYWARIPSHNTLYWASEADFLTLVLNRNYPNVTPAVMKTKEDLLLTFRLRPFGQITVLDNREVKQTKIGTVPGVLQDKPANTNTGTQVSGETSTRYVTQEGTAFTYDELINLLHTGCCYCSSQATMLDYAKKRIYWTGPEEFICDNCAREDNQAQDYLISSGLILPHEITRLQ